MNNVFSTSRRGAANAALLQPSNSTAPERVAFDRTEGTPRSTPNPGKSGGLLHGLMRPLTGSKATTTLQNQVLHASPKQRTELARDLLQDLTEGNTASRHEEMGVSRQFINDVTRTSTFLVPKNGRWDAAEDIRPRNGTSLGDAVQKLQDFCDGDREWAFRVSQYANQNLGNRAWSVGLIGGQGLDGRSYKGRKILRCSTLQGDTESPQNERLELHRTGADSIRLVWHRSRDVASLHLEGRDKPKKLSKQSAGYDVTVSVDVDRPQAGQPAPARLQEAFVRSRLPRPLDA